MKTFILTFGRFKGQNFYETPVWYQNWANNQEWFVKKLNAQNGTEEESPFDDPALKNWDGHGRRGQAAYDRVFEWEKKMAEREDKRMGWYEEGGMYHGIDGMF